jgi:hypothetical protein
MPSLTRGQWHWIVPPYVPKLVEETCNVGDEYYYLTGTSMFMTRQS